MRNRLFAAALILGVSDVGHSIELSGAITGTHDPSQIAYQNGTYYIYSTAENLNLKTSTNLFDWSWGTKPFSYSLGVPDYIQSSCQGGTDASPWNIWAPEIIQNGNSFSLYISRNCPKTVNGVYQEQSILGLATSPSLNSPSWTSQGAVLSVDLNTVHYRVIDPTVITDQSGRMWVAVGSFGSGDAAGYTNGGIRIFELNPSTGTLKTSGDQGTRIAGSWIEAPYLHYHNGYYYLFFNERRCCEGLNSTYFIRVGRSSNITGPYVDKEGTALLNLGGTLFAGLDYSANYSDDNNTPSSNHGRLGRELGPGHVGIFTMDDGTELYTYHYYDSATTNGEPTLGMRSLIWGDDGWPRFGWNPVDGVYAISSTLMSGSGDASTGMYLSVAGKDTTRPFYDGWSGGNAQLWQFTRVGRNQFRITNVQSGASIRAQGDSIALANYNASDTRFHWRVLQTTDRSYRLFNVSTGATLKAPGTSASDQRQWLSPAGHFTIRNQWSAMPLESPSTTSGAALVQATAGSSSRQQWTLSPTNDGYTNIVNTSTGLAMELSGGVSTDNTPIIQSTYAGKDSQKWAIELLPDSSWRLINKASGKIVQTGTKSSGATAVQAKWLSTRNQQWALVYSAQANDPWSDPVDKIRIQAEAACQYAGVLETTNAGYDSVGYVNIDNAKGTAITWAIHSPTAAAYNVRIQYANNGNTSRPMSLSVDGSVQTSSIDFSSTGSWSTWSSVVLSANLSGTEQQLTLTSLDTNGAPNLDWIEIEGAGVTAGSCGSVVTATPAKPTDRMKTALILQGQRTLPLSLSQDSRNLRVTNANGITVLQSPVNQDTRIDLSGLPSGTYVLQARDAQGNIRGVYRISVP